MDAQRTSREWLGWLARVRLLMIILILAVGVFWPQYANGQSASKLFLAIIVFWFMLGSLELILVRWIPEAPWHGGLQLGCDLAVITGVVYATGLQDSYFISLYLLVIIIASILFSRSGTFLTATAGLVLLWSLEILAYAGKIPTVTGTLGSQGAIAVWCVSHGLGFFAVAYLASLLSHLLQSKGRELEEKREELRSAGFHAGHHSLHARRPADDRRRWTGGGAQSDRRRDFGKKIPRAARLVVEGLERRFLAARADDRTGKSRFAKGN